MNKWMCCLLSLFSFNLMAAETSSGNELKMIDEEIQVLQDQLQKNRLAEMKEEVESQGLMIGDWSGYAKDLQHVRKLDAQDEEIEKQIKLLEEHKQSLLKQQIKSKQSPTPSNHPQ